MAGIGYYHPEFPSRFPGVSNATALNAATNKSAMIGHVYWMDEGTHTVSSSGGAVKFVAGTSNTFSNGGSTIDVGIQDVDSSNGPVGRPDGTFDVKGTITGGVATITDSTLITVNMSTGSKNIAHQQLIAIVLDMTARAGSDVVRTSCLSGPFPTGINNRPTMTQFSSSAWGAGAGGQMPNAFIVADDGTYGFLDGAGMPMVSTTTETWGDSTNPDERAMIFELPFAATSDGCWLSITGGVAGADATVCLYSDPTGTPAQLFTPVDILGENYERNSNSGFFIPYPKTSLAASTPYALAVKGAGASNISMSYIQVPDTNCRKFLTGDTTLKKATRNNNTGAFTAESPAVTIYQMAIRFMPVSGGGGGGGTSYGMVGA